jgi:hypothetical protein
LYRDVVIAPTGLDVSTFRFGTPGAYAHIRAHVGSDTDRGTYTVGVYTTHVAYHVQHAGHPVAFTTASDAVARAIHEIDSQRSPNTGTEPAPMRYAHRYAYLPGDPRYAQAWPQILTDTATIIEHVRRAGIVIAGPAGYRRPILDQLDGIGCNGDATTDLDADPFTVLAPLPTSRAPVTSAVCRTGRKPYDLAVTSILLRCHQLVPAVFAIDSDGGWDTDWLIGPQPTRAGATLSARELIGQLFEPYPQASPFVDITEFLTRRR